MLQAIGDRLGIRADSAHDIITRALADLYGLNQPKTAHVTLPTLEQIEAEIARREGL